MIDRSAVEEWSQRLRNARRREESAQAQALLSAFAKIDDAVLREQMVLMLEIVASNPQLLARMKATALGAGPDEANTNVFCFDRTQ